jgi:hypothetical protein
LPSRHRGNATITRGGSLRRRDRTPAAFVEKRRDRREPLSDGFNIEISARYGMIAEL